MSDAVESQSLEQILRTASDEVLGEDAVRAVLEAERECSGAVDLAFPTVSQYLESLERYYGRQAGRGIALRVGRACFAYGLRQYGVELGLSQTSFRLLPFPTKLQALSGAFSSLSRRHAGVVARAEEMGGQLLWHIENCPLCRGRQTAEPVCQFAVGVAEESLYWLSGGKIFLVEEIACIARGDPQCTLRIDKAPLG